MSPLAFLIPRKARMRKATIIRREVKILGCMAVVLALCV